MTGITWLLPDRVFDGSRLREGHAVQLTDGKVSALCPMTELPPEAMPQRLSGTLTPGFVDLQVNGAGGVLFNADPTPETLHQMHSTLHALGTVAILPTVITDRPEVLAAAVTAVLATAGTPGLIGLHIEGPHIAATKRGIHDARFIRPLDVTTLRHVARLRDVGLPTLITLAPEAVAAGQVRQLVALGATVSIGHSDATAEQVQPLLDEGATVFTHLFNAMSPMQGRAPGVTGAAIASEALCGMICDGHHVSDTMLALAIRARPLADRMFLVSDCMPSVGGPDRFSLYGQPIRLENGRLINADGTLAGAHVTMAQSVARAITRLGLPPAQALAMATSVPAHVIGQPHLGQIMYRPAADLLLLDPDWMPRALPLSL